MLYGVIIGFYSSSSVSLQSCSPNDRENEGKEVAFEQLYFKAQISMMIKLKQPAITRIFSAVLYWVAKTCKSTAPHLRSSGINDSKFIL